MVASKTNISSTTTALCFTVRLAGPDSCPAAALSFHFAFFHEARHVVVRVTDENNRLQGNLLIYRPFVVSFLSLLSTAHSFVSWSLIRRP
jgi:hypothetical protein